MLRTLILGTNSIGDDGAALLAGYMASESLWPVMSCTHGMGTHCHINV
jgi:hypothetical protein